MTKSIYIHIPFCKNICTYCDFCKMYYNNEWVEKYLWALEQEIKKNYKNDLIKTIYVGGGTPSCLTKKQLLKLFSILNKIKLSKNYEFTFECNLEDISEYLIKVLYENKVNRLSIGIQTFNKKYLDLMNRRNTDIDKKISICKKYISNINIDLIYGIENQTIEELKYDLDSFIKLDVPHISLYCLILEEHTILKNNNYKELNNDIQRDMYDLIRSTLRKKGYIHYEISNFSKPGFFSKHNLTYWNNNEYYGFGLGASGFIDNIRYTNTRNINSYLKSNYRCEEEVLSKQENMENEMILGLRKINGVSKKKFYDKYQKRIEDVFNVSKLNSNSKYFYISKKYLFVENSILVDFIS